MNKFSALSFFATAVLALGTAQATPLPPGSCIGAFRAPPPCTGFLSSSFPNGGLLLLADQTQAVVALSGGYTGTVISAVYREPSGSLDFLYQFLNNFSSTDAVQAIVISSFAGYQTDVSLASAVVCSPGHGCSSFAPFGNGNSSPLSATRSLPGDTIEFQGFGGLLANPAPNIRPGDISAILMISTDATAYAAGAVTFIDGGSTVISSFGPSAGAPEPGVLSLTMFGIFAGVLARRRALTKRSQFQS